MLGLLDFKLYNQKEWGNSICYRCKNRQKSKSKACGKFLVVEGSENLETEGGYAKEASEEFKKARESFSKTLKKTDIVICTALIPVKKLSDYK